MNKSSLLKGLQPDSAISFSREEHQAVNDALGLEPGAELWFSRRSRIHVGGSTTMGQRRLAIDQAAQAKHGLTHPSDAYRFLWVTEFPLFTRADEDKEFLARGRWSSSHHPFTAPAAADVGLMYQGVGGDLGKVRGQHYDLVLNGMEIGGGSVRVHDAQMQDFIFSEILQLTDGEKKPFDQLLDALRSGAPPHGGIALGFDRLMSILCRTNSIRDVIAFPKTGGGTDLMFKSPATVDEEVMKVYGIRAAVKGDE
jgi:aspartyl-tRNA synthetase